MRFKPLHFLVGSFVCLALGVLVWLTFEQPGQASKQLSEIQRQVARELSVLQEQANSFGTVGIAVNSYNGYHFLVKQGRIVAWSTHLFVPEINWASLEGPKWVRTPRGDYLIQSLRRARDTVVSVLPLYEQFRITNRYLRPVWNEAIFREKPQLLAEPGAALGLPVSVGNQAVFNVVVDESSNQYGAGSLSIITLGVVLLVIGVFGYSRSLALRGRLWTGFVVLLGVFSVARYLMTRWAFPAAWLDARIFDPAAFASSSINASLGDLLLNSASVVVICLYLFLHLHQSAWARKVLATKGVVAAIWSTLFLLLSFFALLFPFLHVETLFHNSSIPLDWMTTLEVDSVRLTAYLAIATSVVGSFLFGHLCIRLSFALNRHSRARWWLSLVVAAGLFAAYALVLGRDYRITLVATALLLGVLFFSQWYKSLVHIRFATFLYLLWIICVHAGQGALSVRRFEQERNEEAIHRFGSTFLVGRDVLAEYLLHEASGQIANDPFIQTRLSSPFFGKNSVRQKVRIVYLSSYFDRYEIQVHLFNSAGQPMDVDSDEDFATFIARFREETNTTGYRGIYFVDQANTETARSYVAVVPVTRGSRTIGFVTIVLSMKKIVPRSVYPELLVDNRFARDFRSADCSYAIFQGDSLESSSGDFDYERGFDARNREANVQSDFFHTWIEGDNGRLAVVTARAYPLFHVFANFSFWTLAGVVLVLMWLMGLALYYARVELRLSYAARIQLYVYAAFVVPLLAVSVTTLTWTSRAASDQLRQEYQDRARLLAETVAADLSRKQTDSLAEGEFESRFTEVTKVAAVDASLYATSGQLLATNQPLLFDNQIVSRWINPRALQQAGGQNGFILDERVGGLVYNNSYHVVRSQQTGKAMAILSIPFFDSAASLERGRANVLANIVIVFVVILLFFTVLSFTATRWLTFPLQLITRSLGRMSLNKENRPLDWKSNDEIGIMVREYNKMVANLERSKIELARSQKESAWREMAQQVAHEIKNPLTPIKLGLQQMEWNLQQGELSKEKAERSIQSVLSQLEILNDIATSFSSFARLPAPILHRLELVAMLRTVAQLYQSNAQGQVTLQASEAAVWIMGDDQLLTRIISNLILNGLQSGEGQSRVRVDVSVIAEGDNAVIRVADNGKGIDPAMYDKVFMPHFTTKKSGSGLGLAIAKQGVEQSGGSISFESAVGRGTTFTIVLPRA